MNGTSNQTYASEKKEGAAVLRLFRLLSGEDQRIAYAVLEGMQLQQKLDAQRKEALQGMTVKDFEKLEYGGNFHCLHSLDKHPIPWDICWEIAIYKQKGLCLSPTHTLIKNIGIGNGTHFNSSRLFGWYEYDRPYRTESIILNNIPIKENPAIEALYAQALKNHGMRYNFLGRMVRWAYLKIKAKRT